MDRVITLSLNGVDKAYPYSIERKLRVIHDEVGGSSIVIFHGPGAVSALDQAEISSSRQSGSAGVFDPRTDREALASQLANPSGTEILPTVYLTWIRFYCSLAIPPLLQYIQFYK